MLAMKPSVFIFTALPCEARPLIDHWKLKRLISSVFPIYLGDRHIVVVTGIGNVAMAGAIGYTFAMFSNIRNPLIVNIGIAGHRDKSLGGLCLAHKIINEATGKTFYPQFPFKVSCETEAVVTLAKARNDYADSALYDMESAGFFEMACKFSSIEVIHSIKIVSDNCVSAVTDINEKLVTTWIGKQLSTIEGVISEIEKSRIIFASGEDVLFEQIKASHHFTASNAVKLKKLLEGWRLLQVDPHGDPLKAEARNGKELMDWLEKELRDKPFYL